MSESAQLTSTHRPLAAIGLQLGHPQAKQSPSQNAILEDPLALTPPSTQLLLDGQDTLVNTHFVHRDGHLGTVEVKAIAAVGVLQLMVS